jgi:hypothetical protein
MKEPKQPKRPYVSISADTHQRLSYWCAARGLKMSHVTDALILRWLADMDDAARRRQPMELTLSSGKVILLPSAGGIDGYIDEKGTLHVSMDKDLPF